MNKLRCLAVDDETLALDLLEDNISKVPFLTLVKRCKNAFDALEVLNTEQVDLVFLDIQMPGLTGLQFLQSLKNVPMVVLITAYEQYALEGFNLDVLDYLVKPYAFDRFLKACNKAQEWSQVKKETPTATTPNLDYIFVNADYSLIKIKIDEIQYIEGLKDYIKIYITTQPKPVITRMGLKAIELKLEGSGFKRVHKSYIINLKHLEFVRNHRIRIGKADIPLSEHYSEAFFKEIGIDRD